MEYQKIVNLLEDTTNQPSRFRTRNWVEVNDESRGAYNNDDNNSNDDNNNIKFKTSIIRSSLCDYSDAYILVKGTITVPDTSAQGKAVNNTNKRIYLKIFKNCAPFTGCITEINNAQVDYLEDIDIIMPTYMYLIEYVMYMCLIEYSKAYSKTSGSLWQYYRDQPALDYNDNIIDFPADNNNSN